MANRINNQKTRRLALLMAFLIGAFCLSACQTAANTQTSGTTAAAGVKNTAASGSAETETADGNNLANTVIAVDYDSDDEDASWTETAATKIELSGASITVSGSGATADGGKATITSAGTYQISGTLADGQIIVDTTDKDPVRLILDGAHITCSNSAPIYVKDAGKVILILADGTENSVADGTAYVFDDTAAEEPNAAIFSKSDLTVNGSGSLTIDANYKHGINSKDELKIMNGTITIESAADGIRGKDYVAVKGGTITISAAADGIQSSNEEDTSKGYVSIEGGVIKITAGLDGIQAATSAAVSGGSLTLTTGGGSANSSSKSGSAGNTWGKWGTQSSSGTTNEISAKGIKATDSLTVAGGTLTIDSSDDALHANGTITISGGTMQIASGDDGIHADSSIAITAGTIDITQCYEGIESADITIGGGDIRLVAADDGINIAGGNDSSSVNGRQGQNTISTSGSNLLTINGGNIIVDAAGDGFDINGSITMTAGSVIINGPTDNGNGPLDYDGTFNVSGGFLIAAGSSGMALAPSTSSSQYSIMLGFTSVMNAGTIVRIQSQSGEELMTFMPTKNFQSLVICSPDIKQGTTYDVYTGGASTGTAAAGGLYSGGTYTAGTKAASLTVSGPVTTYGSSGGMNPRGGGGGGKR
ncbi:MAG: carbohydrate-binding domain-containing protein [Clostridiaceae bacterium]|nr:carbohydrate-binding domain-containing protein [Clostridiaceae bacterium]